MSTNLGNKIKLIITLEKSGIFGESGGWREFIFLSYIDTRLKVSSFDSSILSFWYLTVSSINCFYLVIKICVIWNELFVYKKQKVESNKYISMKCAFT